MKRLRAAIMCNPIKLVDRFIQEVYVDFLGLSNIGICVNVDKQEKEWSMKGFCSDNVYFIGLRPFKRFLVCNLHRAVFEISKLADFFPNEETVLCSKASLGNCHS